MILTLNKGKNLFCNLFLAPAFILYTGIMVFSIAMTIYYSTQDWTGLGASSFYGFNNFIRLTQDIDFRRSLGNTAIFVTLAVIIQNTVGLVLAYMVSRITRGYRFFRASYFMPVVVTSVATATIFVLFYTSNGPLNWWLRLIGLEHLIRPWLSDPNLVRFSVMFPEIWQFTGTYFIIHLAGVQSIPSDVIESAKIDGASSARILTRIIAPMMTEVIQVGILFSMVNAIKSFNFSWIMTGGGPGTQSAYVSVYMYRRIFMDFRYGYGSAMAVVILVALIVITVVFKSVFNSATKDNY